MEWVKEIHLAGRDIDLCLIGWKMPDMDGIEVTRRIRREVGNDVPIVMISAYDIGGPGGGRQRVPSKGPSTAPPSTPP